MKYGWPPENGAGAGMFFKIIGRIKSGLLEQISLKNNRLRSILLLVAIIPSLERWLLQDIKTFIIYK